MMGLLKCPLCCNQEFPTVTQLREHLVYYTYRSVPCAVCNTNVTGGIIGLNSHLMTHETVCADGHMKAIASKRSGNSIQSSCDFVPGIYGQQSESNGLSAIDHLNDAGEQSYQGSDFSPSGETVVQDDTDGGVQLVSGRRIHSNGMTSHTHTECNECVTATSGSKFTALVKGLHGEREDDHTKWLRTTIQDGSPATSVANQNMPASPCRRQANSSTRSHGQSDVCSSPQCGELGEAVRAYVCSTCGAKVVGKDLYFAHLQQHYEGDETSQASEIPSISNCDRPLHTLQEHPLQAPFIGKPSSKYSAVEPHASKDVGSQLGKVRELLLERITRSAHNSECVVPFISIRNKQNICNKASFVTSEPSHLPSAQNLLKAGEKITDRTVENNSVTELGKTVGHSIIRKILPSGSHENVEEEDSSDNHYVQQFGGTASNFSVSKCVNSSVCHTVIAPSAQTSGKTTKTSYLTNVSSHGSENSVLCSASNTNGIQHGNNLTAELMNQNHGGQIRQSNLVTICKSTNEPSHSLTCSHRQVVNVLDETVLPSSGLPCLPGNKFGSVNAGIYPDKSFVLQGTVHPGGPIDEDATFHEPGNLERPYRTCFESGHKSASICTSISNHDSLCARHEQVTVHSQLQVISAPATTSISCSGSHGFQSRNEDSCSKISTESGNLLPQSSEMSSLCYSYSVMSMKPPNMNSKHLLLHKIGGGCETSEQCLGQSNGNSFENKHDIETCEDMSNSFSCGKTVDTLKQESIVAANSISDGGHPMIWDGREFPEEEILSNSKVGNNHILPYIHKKFRDFSRKADREGVTEGDLVANGFQSFHVSVHSKSNSSDVPTSSGELGRTSVPENVSVDHKQYCDDKNSRSFQCAVCKERFNSHSIYELHCKGHGTKTIDNFKCRFCSRVFVKEKMKAIHEEMHGSLHSFECKECNKSFFKFHNFNRHQQEVHGNRRKYVCKVCDRGFFTKRQLINHSDMHAKKLHQCPHCMHMCQTASGLRTHMCVSHGTSDTEHKCAECGEKFKKKYGLQRHMDRKHKVQSFACDICKKVLPCNEDLQSHLKTHDPTNTFRCDSCGKTFSSSWNLRRHSVSHDADPSLFKCDMCNMSFKRKDYVFSHKKLHKKCHSFKCVCGKAFLSKSLLRLHKQKHRKAIDKC